MATITKTLGRGILRIIIQQRARWPFFFAIIRRWFSFSAWELKYSSLINKDNKQAENGGAESFRLNFCSSRPCFCWFRQWFELRSHHNNKKIERRQKRGGGGECTGNGRNNAFRLLKSTTSALLESSLWRDVGFTVLQKKYINVIRDTISFFFTQNGRSGE